jgi:hypothetical protein
MSITEAQVQHIEGKACATPIPQALHAWLRGETQYSILI